MPVWQRPAFLLATLVHVLEADHADQHFFRAIDGVLASFVCTLTLIRSGAA